MNETVNVKLDKEGIQFVGRQLAWGAMVTLGHLIIIGFIAVAILGAAATYFRYGFDGTDDRAAGKRSGVSLRIDHGTGCQYLETSEGGLTPRLTREGKHYCN